MRKLVLGLILCGCDSVEGSQAAHQHSAPSVIRVDLGGCGNDAASDAYWIESTAPHPDAIGQLLFCSSTSRDDDVNPDHGARCIDLTGSHLRIYESGLVRVPCSGTTDEGSSIDGESAWYEARWVVPAW